MTFDGRWMSECSKRVGLVVADGVHSLCAGETGDGKWLGRTEGSKCKAGNIQQGFVH